MKLLVTGATGFIGSFIVEEALNKGLEVWAAVRRTSSKAYLQDRRINFIELNLSSEEKLCEQLKDHLFDYVVHAAGVTKCADKRDFMRINYDGTRNLVNALLRLQMPVRKFVYVSSLSVFGAIREEQPYSEILLTDTPKPNTEYGRSKIESEKFLAEYKDRLNLTILRPTGVYGPREKDYFMMAKSIKQHVDFAVGFKPQDITFVYVSDVVDAVFLALQQKESGRAYFLSDGEVYKSTEFSDLLRKEMGNPWWIRITAPIWLLSIICFFGDAWGKLTGKVTALNMDKFHILSQRNWRCDTTSAMHELGYQPKVKLQEGVRRSIEWYKKNGWL